MLSKESFVALPAIVIYVRGRRLDGWGWATLLVPSGFVAAVTLTGWLMPNVE